MKHVPLFFYPTHWVFVDNDERLLQCMKIAFESISHVQLFSSPKQCVQYINSYQSILSQKNFLISNKTDESFGVLQHSMIDFDITQLVALSDDKNRHDEITNIVIDYQMPEMDGFAVAKSCENMHAHKILLTGTAQDEKIISGFNHHMIDYFIQKGCEGMENKLLHILKKLSRVYFQNKTAALLAHLEAEHVLPLSDPIFSQFFEQYCLKRNIVEYYLIDKQGSFLCVNQVGARSFLVMHTDRSLNQFLDAYGSEAEITDNLIRTIQSRQQTPFFGLSKEAWNIPADQWKNCFYSAQHFSGRENYYWFEVGEGYEKY